MRPLLARSLRITAIPVAVLFLASCSYGPFSVQTRDLPVSTARTPDDPLYADYQWYLDTVAVPDAWGLYAALADDPVAGVDVRTVPVAVIDSGIDGQHEDLRAMIGTGGLDLIGPTPTPIPNGLPPDTYGIDHGTHVSGLVAAAGFNGVGISGVAFSGDGRAAASIVPVRALEGTDGTLRDLIAALLYVGGVAPARATPVARVVNMSLGANQLPDAEALLVEAVVQEVAARDVLLIAAAGNGGAANGVDWPARLSEVIAVGSVDRAANPAASTRSYFSDYGPQVELTAPGAETSGPGTGDTVGIVSTWPGQRYALDAGTSMATPIVAGVAALVWSSNPHLSAQEVRGILQATAVDLGPAGRDDEYGFGLVDAEAAIRRAATNPYGRFESSAAPVPAPSLSTAPDSAAVERALEQFSYDYVDRPRLLVWLRAGTDVGRFLGELSSLLPAEAARNLGPVAGGALITVDPSAGGDAATVVARLTGDPRVRGIAEDRRVFSVDGF